MLCPTVLVGWQHYPRALCDGPTPMALLEVPALMEVLGSPTLKLLLVAAWPAKVEVVVPLFETEETA